MMWMKEEGMCFPDPQIVLSEDKATSMLEGRIRIQNELDT